MGQHRRLGGVDAVDLHVARLDAFEQGLQPVDIEGFVEGCLERIGEDDPDEEQLFRDLWEDEIQREAVIESLKADCEVRTGRPAGH